MRDADLVASSVEKVHESGSFFELASSLGLNTEETHRLLKALGREPTKEELAVCGALWSEHCSYKSSRVHLKRFHTREPWVLQGPGENAGVYAVNESWAIAFKMESHNHPSYIEPYQGAATGVGGILRDVFCMGARPIASLNALRFGSGRWNGHLLRRVVEGIADYGNSVGVPTVGGDTQFHPLYSKNILVNAFTAGLIHREGIFRGVLTEQKPAAHSKSKGYSKTSHLGSVLDEQLKAELFPEDQNILLYFGSATGRDGVHGATMSSSEFSADSETLKPTVQVGDPFAEKVLLEATMALIESGALVGLQDMGAAGLTSSSAEMAGRSGCGVAIDLSSVPLRVRGGGLEAWEILLSESQERMLCALRPADLPRVEDILRSFEIPFSVIGRVNSTGVFTCVFKNQICVELPVQLLTDEAPVYEHPMVSRKEYLDRFYHGGPRSEDVQQGAPLAPKTVSLRVNSGLARSAHRAIRNGCTWADLLAMHQDGQTFEQLIQLTFSHVSMCGRSSLFEHYCATVGGHTVLADGALRAGSASVVRLPREAAMDTDQGIACAAGCQEKWVMLDPLQGSAHSTAAIARKLVATGSVPRAMTDCLNFGSPKDPFVMRQISDSIDGINEVARGLQIPVVSGNVSLNNQTDGIPIPPTPMIGIVGDVQDVSRVVPSYLPQRFVEKERQLMESRSVWLFSLMPTDMSAASSYDWSEISHLWGDEINGPAPIFDAQREKALWRAMAAVHEVFAPGKETKDSASPELALCRPIGRGGLITTLIRLSLESRAHLELPSYFASQKAAELFAEGQAGFVLALASNRDSESTLNLVLASLQKLDGWGLLQQKVVLRSAGQLVPVAADQVKVAGVNLDCRAFARQLDGFFSHEGA